MLSEIVNKEYKYLKDEKYYIFGADIYGKSIYNIAKDNSITILGFLDNNISFDNKSFCNKKIYNPNKIQKNMYAP